MSQVDKKFANFINGLDVKSIVALKEASSFIMEKSDETVPIDTGNLANSKYDRLTDAGKTVSIEVGYTAEYAKVVHENVGANFKRPKARAKFLEKAIYENVDKIKSIIGANFKI